jgi:Domain of unknown function (DUF4410)
MKTFLVALLFQFIRPQISRILGNLLAGCLPVILIGCASSGVVMNVSPVSTGLSISHDFVVVGTSSALGDVEPQKSLLNALIISGLQQTQKFGRVTGNQIAISPTSGIKVNADIKEVYAVSDTARVMVGACAGQARILVQVTVSDLKSGKQIETFEAEGKSSGGSVAAGTTDQAVQRVAEQIVAEVVKISTQASRP